MGVERAGNTCVHTKRVRDMLVCMGRACGQRHVSTCWRNEYVVRDTCEHVCRCELVGKDTYVNACVGRSCVSKDVGV